LSNIHAKNASQYKYEDEIWRPNYHFKCRSTAGYFFFYLSLTRVFNFFSLSLSRKKKDKSTTHNWRTIETSAFFFRLCLGQAAAQAYEIFYRGLVSSGKTNLPVSFEGLSLKRSQCEFGLLYRVQHPGRHSSRLQMIWRLTSGFSRNFAAALTLVG
jgi:hypothetical protein